MACTTAPTQNSDPTPKSTVVPALTSTAISPGPTASLTTSATISVTPATVASAAATSPPTLSFVPAGSIQVERVFPNLSFREMTNLIQPDDASGLMFVTEQRGTINAFAANQPQQSAYLFLDITDRVKRGGNEEGLLLVTFAINSEC